MDTQQQLNYYEARFDAQYGDSEGSLQEMWDRRAGDWDAKYRRETEREQHESRIRDVTEYLLQRGVLRPDCEAVDLGCGPGRFVAAFARHARQVTGVDISPEMARYGEAYCREQGLDNTSFRALDFRRADVAALGWERKFDLAFASITPAINGLQGLDNFLRISRGWCFNASFVFSENRLHRRIMQELFDREPTRGGAAHTGWFYELFNLLWLRGYYPESSYYRQSRELMLEANEKTARRLADFLLEAEEVTEDSTRRILRFLENCADEKGLVAECSETRYGWLLWNAADQRPGT